MLKRCQFKFCLILVHCQIDYDVRSTLAVVVPRLWEQKSLEESWLRPFSENIFVFYAVSRPGKLVCKLSSIVFPGLVFVKHLVIYVQCIFYFFSGAQNRATHQPWPHPPSRASTSLNRCGVLSLWRSWLLCLHRPKYYDGRWGIIFSWWARKRHVLSALLECFKQASLDLLCYSISPQLCWHWFILYPWQLSPYSGQFQTKKCSWMSCHSPHTNLENLLLKREAPLQVKWPYCFLRHINQLVWNLPTANSISVNFKASVFLLLLFFFSAFCQIHQ